MKRMKKAVGIIMSVALGSSLLTGCGGSSNSASAAKEQSTNQEQQTATGNQASEDLPEITWKISHTQSPDNFMNIAAENMARAVAEKTDGKFKIEIYHSGTLGSEQEVIEGMQMGTIAGNLAICSNQLRPGPVQNRGGPLYTAVLYAGSCARTIRRMPAFQPALRGHAAGRGIRKPGHVNWRSRFMVSEKA